MEFWKMSGAGNDFIILDNRGEAIPAAQLPQLARTLCRRRFSIGADGLIAVEDSQNADCRMRFYNADGSVGQMCGNGARCLCRYCWERGLSGVEQTVETAAGIVRGRRVDRRLYRVRLNDPAVMEERPVTVDGRTVPCTYVELGRPGVPHAVVPMENLRHTDPAALWRLGQSICHHAAFPKGANVDFYQLTGPDRLYGRTWERGVEGFTWACGTGAGAVAAVLTRSGQVGGRAVQVETDGGTLVMDVLQKEGRITDLYLTGPTNIVAKGEITDEELRG